MKRREMFLFSVLIVITLLLGIQLFENVKEYCAIDKKTWNINKTKKNLYLRKI